MLRVTVALAILIQTAFGLIGPPSVAAQSQPAALGEIADELIVALHQDGQAQASDVHGKAGGRFVRQVGNRPVHLVKVDPGKSAAVKSAYQRDKRVRFVEHNARVRAAVVPNDPGFGQQWGLSKIEAPAAWDVTRGAATIRVGVVDTGIDANHPDLRGRVVASANFSTAGGVADRNGHGTHVAGTIAAAMNNGAGGAGLAPQTSLVIARALDDSGVGTYADLIEAMNWAGGQGVRILNLSVAGTTPSQAVAEAVAYAQQNGILVVAAAGNWGTREPSYPAAYPGVVAVAATDPSDNLAPFSNSGSWVTLGAPGTDVYSTLPGNRYGTRSGSSMATAHVSGVAALAAAAAPTLSHTALRDVLTDSSDRLAISGTAFSGGRVNARQAVDLARQRAGGSPVPPTSTPAAIAGGGWSIRGSGLLAGPGIRLLSVNVPARGFEMDGSLSFVDRGARMELRSDRIDSLAVVGSTIVLSGTGRVGGKPNHRFRLGIEPRRDGAPAHVTLEVTSGGTRTYAAAGAVRRGDIRIVSDTGSAGSTNGPTATATPTVTPTVTPVVDDGGGIVEAAGVCTQTWSNQPSVTLGDTAIGAVTSYTIKTRVPSQPGGGCNLTTSSTITVTFLTPTDASTITGGTLNGTAIDPATLSATTTSVTFTVPAALRQNLAITIVLNAVTNPTIAGAYTLSMSADAAGGGGGISSSTSSSYNVVSATDTPTSTPTSTFTSTSTSTSTPTATNTPTSTSTPTSTPTTTPTPTDTVNPSFCQDPWEAVTALPASQVAGGVTSYTISSSVPIWSGCDLTTSSSITVSFPFDTDATTITSGTLNTVSLGPISTSGGLATFAAPVGVTAGSSVTIVLNGVTNPTAGGSYVLSLYASGTQDTGILASTNSDAYPIRPPTSTSTATSTATSTDTPTVTPTMTRTPTPTPTVGPCNEFWSSVTASLSSLTTSAVATYTISSTVPSSNGCAIPTSSTIRIDFPDDTDVTTITNGTVNGSTISPITKSGQTVTFAPPVALAPSESVTIVLDNVTNATSAFTFTLDLTVTGMDLGGTINSPSSNTFKLSSPPTETSTATATPTSTATYTVTSTPTTPPKCASPWGAVSVSPSNNVAGDFSIYTINSTVPSAQACQINTGATIAVTLPTDTAIGSINAAYVNGSPVTGAINKVGQQVSFTSPATVSSGAAITVRLDNVTNPTTAGSYALVLTGTNVGNQNNGTIVDTTSSVYSIVAPTPTPTPTATSCPVTVCDSFDRSDSSSLGSPDEPSGQTWQLRDSNTIGICGGEACGKSVGGEGAYATLDFGLSTQSGQVTLVPTDTTGAGGLILRATSTLSRMLVVEVDGSGTLIVWLYQSPYWYWLGDTTVSATPGSAHTLGATASGSTVQVQWDGSTVLTVGDAEDASATRVGIYVSSIGGSSSWPTLDDFTASSPGSTLPTLTPTATSTPFPTPTVNSGITCSTSGATVCDEFNRSDSRALYQADSGQYWGTDGGTWGIESGAARLYSPPGSEGYARVTTNLTEQAVTARIKSRSTASRGWAGVIARVTPNWNSYLLWVGLEADGSVEVWKLTNGAWSFVGSASTSQDSSVDRDLKVSASGTSLTVHVGPAGGSLTQVLGPLTVPAVPTSATMAGLYVQSAGGSSTWATYDSFTVAPP